MNIMTLNVYNVFMQSEGRQLLKVNNLCHASKGLLYDMLRLLRSTINIMSLNVYVFYAILRSTTSEGQQFMSMCVLRMPLNATR